MQETRTGFSLPVGSTVIMFVAILVGLLLLVIGDSQNSSGVYYAGAFILPAALFWGAFFLKEENTGLRIAFLAVGGYLAASLLAGLASLSSLIR